MFVYKNLVEWLLSTVNVSLDQYCITIIFDKFDKGSFASGFILLLQFENNVCFKKTEFWSFGLVSDWCNKAGLRYLKKTQKNPQDFESHNVT